MKGSITNAGPCMCLSMYSLWRLLIHALRIVDATISFGSGLTVAWLNAPLGTIRMGDVHLVGDVGATINMESTFEVADVDQLTAFTKVFLPFFLRSSYSFPARRPCLLKSRSSGLLRERTFQVFSFFHLFD